MSKNSAIAATRRQFPDASEDDIHVSALKKGGSDRKFYRVHTGLESQILIQYNADKEENAQYVSIANFLSTCNLRIPEVYHHDATEKVIWMQDLGTVELWHFREEPWAARKPYYVSALEQTARLQLRATAALPTADLKLQAPFDETLYRWEQDYFFDNCLEGALAIDPAEVTRFRTSRVFADIVSRLAELPRSLVHRDFQSQNLMIHRNEAWLIDFQGMRLGLPQYDLASLLYDPYVTMTDSQRIELLQEYKWLIRNKGSDVTSDFVEIFDLCALQRLMQALGAYGFLGLKKNKPHFLDHIPAAKKSLIEVAERIVGLEDFVALLKQP